MLSVLALVKIMLKAKPIMMPNATLCKPFSWCKSMAKESLGFDTRAAKQGWLNHARNRLRSQRQGSGY